MIFLFSYVTHLFLIFLTIYQNYLITQSMKIIRGMFENGVTVIITTNYPKDSILKNFGEPLTNTIFHKNNINLRFIDSYK